jgi:hypothetical protein
LKFGKKFILSLHLVETDTGPDPDPDPVWQALHRYRSGAGKMMPIRPDPDLQYNFAEKRPKSSLYGFVFVSAKETWVGWFGSAKACMGDILGTGLPGVQTVCRQVYRNSRPCTGGTSL